MEIIINELTDDEKLLGDVRRFLFKQIKTEFGFDYVPEWHRDIMNLEEFYISPERNNFYVAFNESNDIIATIGLRAYDKDFAEFRDVYSKDKTASIWRLFVDCNYRRCGLASEMFGICENFAVESGFESIYLHTHKTSPGALEFWTKMGFIVALDACNDLQTVHMDKDIRKMDISPAMSSFSYAIE